MACFSIGVMGGSQHHAGHGYRFDTDEPRISRSGRWTLHEMRLSSTQFALSCG